MFEIGESVMINPDIKVGESYDNWRVTHEMLDHKGCVFEICEKERDNRGVYYRLNIPNMRTYCWTDEMLIPAGKLEPASEDELKELFG